MKNDEASGVLAQQRATFHSENAAAEARIQHGPMRIWAMECPFKKSGAPVLGTFGSITQSVVIVRADDWTRLCSEIPELGRRQFEVGTYD